VSADAAALRRPMRVLAFVTDFNIGGTERQVVNLARGLERSGFELHLACFRRSGAFFGELDARSVRVRHYRIARLYGARTLLQQLRLARYLRRHAIDLVHTFGFYPNVFALPAARLARTPATIASIRDTGDHLTPLQRRVQRAACSLADVVLANSGAVGRRLVADGYDPGRIEVVYNGVDTGSYTAASRSGGVRQQLGLAPGERVVAVLSRLSRLKGLEFFLQAAASLAPRFPGVRFLVVGDNTIDVGYRGELAAYAARLGLAERVIFTGFRSDVPELLAATTVSVLPSLTEGLSNALLEAMAAGVPVVATSVGGNPETVVDGVTGLLVPPRDPDALATAIARLLLDPGLAASLGQAGHRRLHSVFSLERMVSETEARYRSLLAGAAARRKRAPARAVERLGDALARPRVDRVLDALEQGGLRQVARRALGKLGASVAEMGSLAFFRRDIGAAAEGPRRRLPLSVRRATFADLERVLESSDPRRGRDLVVERLARGDWCFLAFDADGRPIHSGWATLTRARVPELEKDVLVREHEAYLYDAYTPPSRRGHGAFGFVLDHIFAELQARGVKATYSYVRSDDPEGQRSAAQRLRPIGCVHYLRLRWRRAPLLFGAKALGLPLLVDPDDRPEGADVASGGEPDPVRSA
jgi:glycosyltransferase involved in cell wall biosynthesis